MKFSRIIAIALLPATLITSIHPLWADIYSENNTVRYEVIAPTSTTVGTTIDLLIKAVNSSGAITPLHLDSIKFLSTDARMHLTYDTYTFSSYDKGVANITKVMSFDGTGTYIVSVQSVSRPGISGNFKIDVTGTGVNMGIPTISASGTTYVKPTTGTTALTPTPSILTSAPTSSGNSLANTLNTLLGNSGANTLTPVIAGASGTNTPTQIIKKTNSGTTLMYNTNTNYTGTGTRSIVPAFGTPFGVSCLLTNWALRYQGQMPIDEYNSAMNGGLCEIITEGTTIISISSFSGATTQKIVTVQSGNTTVTRTMTGWVRGDDTAFKMVEELKQKYANDSAAQMSLNSIQVYENYIKFNLANGLRLKRIDENIDLKIPASILTGGITYATPYTVGKYFSGQIMSKPDFDTLLGSTPGAVDSEKVQNLMSILNLKLNGLYMVGSPGFAFVGEATGIPAYNPATGRVGEFVIRKINNAYIMKYEENDILEQYAFPVRLISTDIQNSSLTK